MNVTFRRSIPDEVECLREMLGSWTARSGDEYFVVETEIPPQRVGAVALGWGISAEEGRSAVADFILAPAFQQPETVEKTIDFIFAWAEQKGLSEVHLPSWGRPEAARPPMDSGGFSLPGETVTVEEDRESAAR